jgi:putative peptidoglycan lipid II flippase
VLSASFIPVYARLNSEGRHQEARRVAGAVAGLLGLVVAILVALGVTAAPWLLQLLFPGFTGAKRDLAVLLSRILFPGTGLLVLSAWCLGVLNSHRHFFLSYAAPVIWNIAIISAALLAPAGKSADAIVVWAAWGAVAGSFLQFAIQLPSVWRLAGGISPSLDAGDPGVRVVLGSFFPAFVSRGVVQISAFVDSILASFLGAGAVAALGNAQMLYSLPISLFGMSVAAAELPELAVAAGGEDTGYKALRSRLEQALSTVAYFIVPSAVALASLGNVLAGAVYQTGAFRREDVRFVWMILAGSAIGLLATTLGRLYSSAWYALRDTRTPLRFAIVRVLLTTVLGWFAALQLPSLLGVPPSWGTAGLTASAGIAGWVEYFLLRRSLERKLGLTRLDARMAARLWASALVAAGVGWGVLLLLQDRPGPVLTAAAVLLPYGVVYFSGTYLLGVPFARGLATRYLRRA